MAEIIHRRRPPMVQASPWKRRGSLRLGFTMLEFIVAMIVLGIALTGLFPLQVMQSRGIESLELRYTQNGTQVDLNTAVMRGEHEKPEDVSSEDYGYWYLTPSSDPLASKLGAAVSFSRSPPTTVATPPVNPIIPVDDDPNGTNSNYNDLQYSTVPWTFVSSSDAYGGIGYRQHTQDPPNSTDPPTGIAVWTFTIVTPGLYSVMATWPESSSNPATSVQYVIKNGAGTEYTCQPVHQNSLPDDAYYKGRPWQVLMSRYFESGTITVQLSSKSIGSSTGSVVADAVRIVPATEIISLEKSFNSEEVTVRVKIPHTSTP